MCRGISCSWELQCWHASSTMTSFCTFQFSALCSLKHPFSALELSAHVSSWHFPGWFLEHQLLHLYLEIRRLISCSRLLSSAGEHFFIIFVKHDSGNRVSILLSYWISRQVRGQPFHGRKKTLVATWRR